MKDASFSQTFSPQKKGNSKMVVAVTALFLVVAVGTVSFGNQYLADLLSPLPTCTLANNGPVAPGTAATLSWTVAGNPTRGQLINAAMYQKLNGTPNFTANGSIQTTALSEAMSFQLDVTNANGSGSCRTTIQMSAAQGGNAVRLSQQTPVFKRRDIPNGYDGPIGYYPFQNIEWVGGQFVAAGNCNSTAGGSGGQLESGGMYAFSENGAYLGTTNVCFDTAEVRSSCFEGGGCRIDPKLLAVDATHFLLAPRSRDGYVNRPPVLYQSGGSGPSMATRLFTNSANYGQNNGEINRFHYVAVSNGIMVGVQEKTTGPQAYSYKTAFYALPSMERLAEYDYPATLNPQSALVPIVGVGSNYFLAADYGDSTAPIHLYRMPSASELQAGQRPQKVQTLSQGLQTQGPFLSGYSTDPSNANRITLYWTKGQTNTLSTYETNATGLQKIGDKVLSGALGWPSSWGGASSFATMGEYLAYSKCTGTLANRSCALVVEKNGQTLNVDAIPTSSDGAAQEVIAIAISPNGKILVSANNRNSTDNGNVYLYSIENFSSSSANTPPEESTPPNPSGTNNNTDNTSQNPPSDNTSQQNPSSLPSGQTSSERQTPAPTTNPDQKRCADVGGKGCTQNVESGELQLGQQGRYGCSQNDFCVECAEGYQWSGGALGNCQPYASCSDASVGGNGCTFSVREGELPLGGPGAYGCVGFQSYCVECATGYTWDGSNCTQ